MKFAVTTSGTAVPSGMLLSISALSNVAMSVAPSDVTLVVTAGNNAVDSGALS